MKPKVVPKTLNRKIVISPRFYIRAFFFLPNLVVFWIKKWGSFLGNLGFSSVKFVAKVQQKFTKVSISQNWTKRTPGTTQRFIHRIIHATMLLDGDFILFFLLFSTKSSNPFAKKQLQEQSELNAIRQGLKILQYPGWLGTKLITSKHCQKF